MDTGFYHTIARALAALANCERNGRADMADAWREYIDQTVKTTAPSGSGFDLGTKLDMVLSKPERLVFITSFHHMDDGGFYSGWTDHKVIARPSFVFGIDLKITGRNANGVKGYMYDVFSALADEKPAPFRINN